MTVHILVGEQPPATMQIDPHSASRQSFAIFMPSRTTISTEADGRRVPIMMSSEQAYYWSRAWQEGELEAEQDLESGRSRIFANGQDAAAWLLSDD